MVEWKQFAKELIPSRERIEEAILKAVAHGPGHLVQTFMERVNLDKEKFVSHNMRLRQAAHSGHDSLDKQSGDETCIRLRLYAVS